ncbi:MAG: Uncharacterised protein [Synechococcus sp. MIT S9220]|nr:MAG: Uncharacterised protein [Synechococcus sp. MIT S9220]
MDAPPISLGGDQLLVGVLHRHGTTLHVVEGDGQTLSEIARRVDGISGVITNLFEKTEHGLREGRRSDR